MIKYTANPVPVIKTGIPCSHIFILFTLQGTCFQNRWFPACPLFYPVLDCIEVIDPCSPKRLSCDKKYPSLFLGGIGLTYIHVLTNQLIRSNDWYFLELYILPIKSTCTLQAYDFIIKKINGNSF